MRAVAWCTLAGGDRVALGHGDLIGRLPSAALVVDDARVSEAHAYISLRGAELRLLGLRGRFSVRGRVLGDITLEEGLEVDLAAGLTLRVEEVVLPDALLGVEGAGLPLQALTTTVSLDTEPVPRLRPGGDPDAAAMLWSFDDAWRIAVRGRPPRSLDVGDEIDVHGFRLRAVAVPLREAAFPRTVADYTATLRVEACVDTVRVGVGSAPPAIVGGLPGRLLAELVAIGGPVEWVAVAAELWRHDAGDPERLRRRWDVAISRLRTRLRGLGVRPDLIHHDGAGHVELLLRPGDVALDVD